MKPNLLRVLVADDEPAIRRVVGALLSARGYAVDDARSGEEAVMAIRARSADFALLDINMPGMGGSRRADEFVPRSRTLEF